MKVLLTSDQHGLTNSEGTEFRAVMVTIRNRQSGHTDNNSQDTMTKNTVSDAMIIRTHIGNQDTFVLINYRMLDGMELFIWSYVRNPLFLFPPSKSYSCVHTKISVD
jgi:hypothetical protein